MTNSIIFMMFGVLIYVLGLMSGWNMRSSVKGEELQRYQDLSHRMTHLRAQVVDALERLDEDER